MRNGIDFDNRHLTLRYYGVHSLPWPSELRPKTVLYRKV